MFSLWVHWIGPKSSDGPAAGQEKRERLGRPARIFVAGDISGVLTPHPGPLPFEGRGSATSDPGVSNIVSRVRGIRVRALSKRGAGTRITQRVRRDSLSPQRGEGRGEGEAVRLA